jgi:hypothetical protein
MTWRIQAVNDYHDIKDEKPYRAIELGCFPTTSGYAKYFALYYKGRRPPMARILASLRKKVIVGKFIHARTGAEIGWTWDEIVYEVKSNVYRMRDLIRQVRLGAKT